MLILGMGWGKHRMSGASYSVRNQAGVKKNPKEQKGTCFNSIYTKIGTIGRRFSWPLYKDDMQIVQRSIFL